MRFTDSTVKKDVSAKSRFQHIYPLFICWRSWTLICIWCFLLLLSVAVKTNGCFILHYNSRLICAVSLKSCAFIFVKCLVWYSNIFCIQTWFHYKRSWSIITYFCGKVYEQRYCLSYFFSIVLKRIKKSKLTNKQTGIDLFTAKVHLHIKQTYEIDKKRQIFIFYIRSLML